MAKHVCLDGTMVNTTAFSSPVPIIGLYIAVVSSVCFSLILCDVWAGIKSRKFWFPCRFFSFNSVTLTLVSVAAKIPVDLTSVMPSLQDQLSKLSGTVFICVTMSFMLSSVTTNVEFESYANVTALTIFVVTVAVNICIQMATGVIFAFIPEHVFILVCMLVLLIRFWFTVTIMNGRKVDYIDKNKNWIRNGKENLSARLTDCYLSSYQSCLQLNACRAPHLADVAILSAMSSFVLVQAMLRSLVLKDLRFCKGVSDYGWSMWLVAGSQITTVAIVSLVIGVRCFTNLAPSGFGNTMKSFIVDDPYLQFQYLLSMVHSPRFLVKTFRYLFYAPLYFINLAVTIINTLVQFIIAPIMSIFGEPTKDENFQELKDQLNCRLDDVESWVLRKGAADMERWLKINKKYAVDHVANLFKNRPALEKSVCVVDSDLRGIKLSSLSVILLAEVMMRIKRESRRSISYVLDEVFEIIQFIDSNLQVGSSEDRQESTLARAIHKYGFRSAADNRLMEQILDPQYHSRCTISYTCLFGFTPQVTDHTLHIATRPINHLVNPPFDSGHNKPRPSNEVVYTRLEQQFVDMLHAFLAQLPLAVLTHILKSPVEEYHERVRICLGFICKIQPLQSHIIFSPPSDHGIITLFNAQTTAINTQVEDSYSMSAVPTTAPAVQQAEILILGDVEMGRSQSGL